MDNAEYNLTVSILECVLYDFLTRVQEHSNEKIANLSDEEIFLIKDKELPNALSNYIDLCKKHKIFSSVNNIHKEMYDLCDYRNRVHIQNLKKKTPDKEYLLWNRERKHKYLMS